MFLNNRPSYSSLNTEKVLKDGLLPCFLSYLSVNSMYSNWSSKVKQGKKSTKLLEPSTAL